jgi:hypothetical protein
VLKSWAVELSASLPIIFT